VFEQSKWFFHEFSSTFIKGSPYYPRAVASYTQNAEFTSFITQRINEIIRSNDYTAQNEYYRIDAMGYRKRWRELDKSSLLSPHLWDLEIAVEHENSSKDWLDEVIKLAHICCPLRVVIGYVPLEQRPCGDAERLAYVSSALRLLKCRENLKNGEFMIILGNSNTKCREENFFNYKAYVLNAETLCFEALDSYLPYHINTAAE